MPFSIKQHVLRLTLSCLLVTPAMTHASAPAQPDDQAARTAAANATGASSTSADPAYDQTSPDNNAARYQAGCMFIDWVLALQLPDSDTILARQRQYLTPQSSRSLQEAIGHFSPANQLYRYTNPGTGVKARILKRETDSFYLDAEFDASKIPSKFRTRSYLTTTVNLIPASSASNTALLECDAHSLKLTFDKDRITHFFYQTQLD